MLQQTIASQPGSGYNPKLPETLSNNLHDVIPLKKDWLPLKATQMSV